MINKNFIGVTQTDESIDKLRNSLILGVRTEGTAIT